MKPVFIASTPNSQEDDREISRELILKTSLWKTGDFEEEVIHELGKLFRTKYSFTFDTGRASLYSIFKAINIQNGDEVIIQAFTCLAVPLPIKWAKATPIYVDINPKTFNPDPSDIQNAITSKTRAVVVQHTFGIPAKIDDIIKIVDNENEKRTIQNKIYLIEDLAHSLGSEFKGKKLGTYGDVAMLSFGQEKVISCTQGGAVVTNDDIIGHNLTKEYENLEYLSKFQIFRNIIHPLLWNVINKTYYLPPVVSIGKLLILLFRLFGLLKNQADPNSNIDLPIIHKFSNAQSKMLLNQLDKLDEFTKHRKEITAIYESKLKLGKLALLRYPIVSENRDIEIRKLKNNRIISGNWYNSPIHPLGTDLQKFDYVQGSCLNTEKISTQILNLPTGINVSIEQAKFISSLL